MKQVFQIKITLKNITPLIWRRILVKADVKLPDLHKIIQTVMGWTNSHLHQFICKDKHYSNPEYDDEWDDRWQVDYSNVKLSDLISEPNRQFVYEYDFGDSWAHTLKIEKIFPAEKGMKYPTCIVGERCCPPEDCGSAGGYEDLLEIIKNPDDEEYESMMEWLGGYFEPEFFDIEEVNAALKEKDFGCFGG